MGPLCLISRSSCHDGQVIPTVADLVAIGRAAGLAAVGATEAAPFERTRVELEQRKAKGLSGDMQFTYRNPDRSTDPRRTMSDATCLIVGAYDYQRELPTRPTDQPTGRVATYSSEDHYASLRAALERVAEPLRAAGFAALVLADQNHLVDRAAAHRAGIGWWGKSSNVLVPGIGSLVVLGSVLTNAPLRIERVAEVEDGCKTCTKCLDGCPTKAIISPGVVDANKCLAWLLQASGSFPVEYRELLGDRIYGCDDCQDVCPPNQIRRKKPATQSDEGAWVPILDILELDDQTLMARLGRWYVPDRDPDYLRRNALVVLGNIGRGDDERTGKVLTNMLAHHSPVVVAHAVWAARRLSRDDLLGELAGSNSLDEMVSAELQRPVSAVA
ncbi:MAG: tRNA epoxyqueuosine(34) reductase QueG [Acidimicrobiaceae bacterium]|nr:tRNA epoxyqueuosine(34) reductase QueG [Acidimicrobiaceae bacterium]MYA73922.1 tRNA epoxyqueuosine(34) reductase QueG [Acidimicrobiaceae bacterium]MYD05927.1 tRNA epoxyqueuosine(34) reductase QueG [Acidimicrobiaceae bacterium]MYG54946.1 tRNA epoxyqueuosine(34) reductase QueG [Acidimicrobiaceae bacterium]MYI58592.1 tRNA epoxyqueuosine(34) reductase QueG [Acidimicrobiaceae bacterium]